MCICMGILGVSCVDLVHKKGTLEGKTVVIRVESVYMHGIWGIFSFLKVDLGICVWIWCVKEYIW